MILRTSYPFGREAAQILCWGDRTFAQAVMCVNLVQVKGAQGWAPVLKHTPSPSGRFDPFQGQPPAFSQHSVRQCPTRPGKGLASWISPACCLLKSVPAVLAHGWGRYFDVIFAALSAGEKEPEGRRDVQQDPNRKPR